MSNSTFFSIIIPCYNQAHFLNDAINSIIRQDFQKWEVIIVDDGSTDNTLALAEEFATNDERVRVYSKSNGGLSSARNAGIKHATGEVLLFLDSDDFLVDECLGRIRVFFEVVGPVDIIRIGYQHVNERGDKILHRVLPNKLLNYIPSIFTTNFGPPNSVIIKKSLAVQIGSFDETLQSAEDWDFWMRAVKAGAKVRTLKEVLVSYRYVKNSMSRDGFRMYRAQKEVMLRGPKRDVRINIPAQDNIDRNVDVSEGIKKQMLMCSGVAVMQGKIDEACKLYTTEQEQFNWIIKPFEFNYMYSYLSFRYWSSSEEINRIFNEFYPRFNKYFEALKLSKQEREVAMKAVFINPMRIRNRIRYGKTIGKLVNYFSY
jgi:glycosyltransferase involved in cell wall biosynthesis